MQVHLNLRRLYLVNKCERVSAVTTKVEEGNVSSIYLFKFSVRRRPQIYFVVQTML